MMRAECQPVAQTESQHDAAVQAGPENPDDACPYKQPVKCVACVWGRWEASRQFCMLPVCIKEAVPDGNSRERG
ncbi:hypothetical protein FE783_19315 [Paenibacillus mesophilus]|uniref:hypothetical protein n=1 Tax=Paenibacillus mesophilus TaxID=2582849 RepID=UPI00110F1F37|nr:hypothetical protein [Paenibacillus mesophilus]TMV48104.1 hypothetical protein FE783_19315 [Paenibacillus mesophilus]